MSSEFPELIRSLCYQTGSTWVSRTDYIAFFREKRKTNPPPLEPYVKSGEIKKHGDYFSVPELVAYENATAIGAMRLQYANAKKYYSEDLIRKYIKQFEDEENEGRKLHYHQADAVIMAINANFCVLTGGPGTGKTTVVSCIIYCMRKILGAEVNICLTAPTGKAARVLRGSTGENATTFHKRFNVTFTSRSGSIFYEDVLFVDESSFADIEMASILFNNVPDGRKVVFIGDVDQLPSVGPGAVLRDIIASGCIPVTMLTHTFRQSNDSTLFTNIQNIRNGCTDVVAGPDYFPILLENEDNAFKVIRTEYMKAVKKWGAENVVVLLPYRRKGICSNTANSILQAAVNPEKQGYNYHGTFFKKGDFVMQLQNREEIVNGDVGKIIKASNEGIVVEYVDVTVSYLPQELGQLALAYAMTIHKSQGSEYKSVIMVLLDSHKAMLHRNMLYTGVTRAKKECTLIYTKDAYEKAVTTTADADRITFLAEKMRHLKIQYQMIGK